MRFKDKIAVITGISREIGKETALQFLTEGATVILCRASNMELQKTVETLKADFQHIKYYAVNTTDKTEVDKLFDNIIKEFGTIDILINGAANQTDTQFCRINEEHWDIVADVNLKATFNCCTAASNIMKQRQSGKIINISPLPAPYEISHTSSLYDVSHVSAQYDISYMSALYDIPPIPGMYGGFNQLNYPASKVGIIEITKLMTKELSRYNININVIAPGFILTETNEKTPEKILQMIKERVPLNRLGLPSDVAKACLFLASDDADYCVGGVYMVDGGQSAI